MTSGVDVLGKALDELKCSFLSAEELEQTRLAQCDTSSLLQLLSATLKKPADGGSHIAKAAEVCAELAKSESCREKLHFLLSDLANLLKNDFTIDCETTYQVHRAIGNICFDNDEARQIFLDAGGILPLVSGAVKWLTMASPTEDCPDVQKMGTVVFGCLCNLLDNNLSCQTAALSCSEFLQFFAAVFCDEKWASLHSLLLDALFSISQKTELRKQILDSSLIFLVLSKLKNGFLTAEDSETALDFLTNLSHAHGALTVLIKNRAVTVLASVFDRFKTFFDEETEKNLQTNSQENLQKNSEENLENNIEKNVAKNAGNLLVELLADAESFEILPKSEQETVLFMAASWLTERKNICVSTTAALVIGNLARNKKSCEKIFDLPENIPAVFLNVLKETSFRVFTSEEVSKTVPLDDSNISKAEEKNAEIKNENLENKNENLENNKQNSENDSENSQKKNKINPQLQLQYAVLCALKNLAVDEELRRRLIAHDVVSTLITAAKNVPFNISDKAQIPVLGKILTLLRMCAFSNEEVATSIGQNFQLVQLILNAVELSEISQEAIRLLIVLLGFQFLTSSLKVVFLNVGFLTKLTTLIANDSLNRTALLALAFILLTPGTTEENLIANEIKKSDLIQILGNFLTAEKLVEKSTDAVFLAVLRLLNNFAKFSSLKEILTNEILPIAEKCCSFSQDETVKKMAESLISKLT